MFPKEFLAYCPLVVQARQTTDKPVNESQTAKCDFRPDGSCLKCKTCNYVLHPGVHPNSMGARFMAALRAVGKFPTHTPHAQPEEERVQLAANTLMPIELREHLQRLQKDATPGPWAKWRLGTSSDPAERCIITTEDGENEISGIFDRDADVDLVVTLVAHLPMFMTLLDLYILYGSQMGRGRIPPMVGRELDNVDK